MTTSEAGDAGVMLDYFRDLIREGLRLQAQLDQAPGEAPPVDRVYADLGRHLDAGMAEARRGGKSERDVNEAAFAVVAWLDELIARYPDWWAGYPPLQKTRFSTNNAGNEFYTHLSGLTPEQDEVREIYYLVMALGFVGQYYFDSGGNSEYSRVIEQQGRQLPEAPAKLHTLAEERVTPQPYLMPDPPGPRMPSHWDRILLRLALAAAVVVPLSMLVWAWLARPRVQEPAEDLAAGLRAAEAQLECKWLKTEVGPDGAVKVRGVAAKQEDVEKFRQLVSHLKTMKSLDTAGIEIQPWPFCEVYEVLGDLRERTVALGRPARLKLNGERFSAARQAEVTAQHRTDRVAMIASEAFMAPTMLLSGSASDFQHQYVDAYGLSEQAPERYLVWHIFPEMEPYGVWEPNESGGGAFMTLLGSGKLPVGYEVHPPFGREMLVLLTSPAPLFAERRKREQGVKQYLQSLREIVGKKEVADTLLVDFAFYTTQP